ncbi:hypothetical protein LCGC14_3126410, partial [marine sediment metagenome]
MLRVETSPISDAVYIELSQGPIS